MVISNNAYFMVLRAFILLFGFIGFRWKRGSGCVDCRFAFAFAASFRR